MGIIPTDKYIMEDYRRALGTNDAPQMINTEREITPVAVINGGLPRPNAKQRIKHYNYYNSGDNTVQIASVTANLKIFYLGAVIGEGGGTAIIITDTNTGVINVADANITNLHYTSSASASPGDYKFLPLPVQCNTGIRLRVSSGVASTSVIIYYLEEDVI